jgi:hypothetical protein
MEIPRLKLYKIFLHDSQQTLNEESQIAILISTSLNLILTLSFVQKSHV